MRPGWLLVIMNGRYAPPNQIQIIAAFDFEFKRSRKSANSVVVVIFP